ncbi:MAG: hypothetical protein AAFX56_19110 [Pseudomonadota bacterium]
MTEPELELGQRNLIGALDRIVTHLALAMVAAVATLFVAIARPWRLAPLLSSDEPDGRDGVVLSPGAYLPLSLALVLLAAAAVTTPDTLQSNQGFLGPGLAVAVANAIAEGDVWKTLSIVLPIYAYAVCFGVLGRVLTPWAGAWWTLRTSLRAAFYQVATVVGWIVLSSAAIDAYRVASGNGDNWQLLYALNTIPIVGLSLWMYFWFFKSGESVSSLKAAALTLGIFALMMAFFMLISELVF